MCCEEIINITINIAGMPGLLLLAGQIERNRVRGVPIPERRHSLAKPTKLARCHIDEIPIPPTTAIAGVALKMKRPAEKAMYAAMNTQRPRSISPCFSFLAPFHIMIKATPIEIRNTIGPYEAKRTPRLGACASPIVPKILFLEK